MRIVPAYAAGLALFCVLLAARVIRARGRHGVSLGPDGGEELQRAIRVHANFAEYVPFALLLAFAEGRGAAAPLLHASCAVLVLGRLIHAWGVSRRNEDLRFRITGVALTLTVIGATALLLLLG